MRCIVAFEGGDAVRISECRALSSCEGMAMLMEGFGSARGACLNLWRPAWTLDTPLRLGVGLVASFVAGGAVESLARLRERFRRRRHLKWALALHFVATAAGYLAMLAAMSYAVELFVAVCVGATLGHLPYLREGAPLPPQHCDPVDPAVVPPQHHVVDAVEEGQNKKGG
ncbi:hypothetical protein CTAYLR_003000 [Chrysophaeum taylorii]|uniref:Copper transport protein n=1 Tax=Chrysophaeum taylorii TaxID=2483200 RepID=A0AAD7U5W5_9STRA|nr:hypothetical protein CTAYLR_003000 [Chrysophaeum taylorii]